MTTGWEYKFIISEYINEVEGKLNEMGKKGWEAVGVSLHRDDPIFILMKKPVFSVEVALEEPIKYDINLLYTGKPRNIQSQLQKVLGVIADMEKTGPVKDDDLYELLANEHGVNRSDAAKLISTLMRDGTIHSPRPGYFRRAS